MADVSAAHVHIHLNVYPCGVRLFFSLSPSFPFPPFPKGTHIYLHLWGSDLSVIMHPVGQDKASEEDEYAGRHQACGNCKYRCVKCSPGCSAECSAVCSGDTLPPPPIFLALYMLLLHSRLTISLYDANTRAAAAGDFVRMGG